MLKIGPYTQAYLDNPIDRSEFRSIKGHFFKDIILEIRNAYRQPDRFKSRPIYFTMRDNEWNNLVSIKQIYMNSADEFDCAIKCFGSWDHWLHLLNDRPFLEGPGALKGLWTGVASWREEKRLFEQDKAKKIITDLAEKGNFAAAKMLYDNTVLKETVGRPSKQKVLEKITEEAEKTHKMKSDISRIRLAINNASKNPKTSNG